MVAVEIKTWAVHIYIEGKYNRTVEVTFTKEGAAAFCKSFNGERSAGELLAIEAVPIEHRALVAVEAELIN